MKFIMQYLSAEQSIWLQQHNVTIEFFDHDWTLNDLAQADPHEEGRLGQGPLERAGTPQAGEVVLDQV